MILIKKLGETFPEGQFLINRFTQQYWIDANPKAHGLVLYFEENVISRQNLFTNDDVDIGHSFIEIIL